MKHLTNENKTISIFKGIACLLVVFIHIHPRGSIGTALEAMGRFGVPFFFAAAGYFSVYEDNTKAKTKARSKIKRTLLILLIAVSIYTLTDIVVNLISSNAFDTTFSWPHEPVYPVYLLFLLAFNVPLLANSGPLWFLYALLYCYLLLYWIDRKGNHLKLAKKAPLLIPLNILFVTVLYALDIRIGGMKMPSLMAYRNWFFFGVPFFMTGYLMRASSETIKTFLSRINHKELILVIVFIAGLLLSVGERFLYQKLFNDYLEFYIGSTISVLAALSLSMVANIKHGGYIGKNLSLGIYLIHPVLIRFLSLTDKVYGTGFCTWYAVLPLSILLSLAIHLISSQIKRTLHS